MNYKYKYEAMPDELPRIFQEIVADNPTEIAIDTETNGLDPVYHSPYQIIIGWYDQNKVYKHYLLNTEDREGSREFLQWFMDSIEQSTNILTVFHNAKFDITKIQFILGEEGYRPKPGRFFCTLVALPHFTNYNQFGLKIITEMLHLKSKFDYIANLETQMNQIDQQYGLPNALTPEQQSSVKRTTGPLKAQLIRKALEDGEIPWSTAVEQNLSMLSTTGETTYFETLFTKPEELVKHYAMMYTDDMDKLFRTRYAMKHGWELGLRQTYNYIKDVYSFGPNFELAKQILRDFNREVFGYTSEWARLFGSNSAVLANLSYEELRAKYDRTAFDIYAGMDGKLTLDIYEWLKVNHLDKATEEQLKVMRIDFDVTYALIMQEKVGFQINEPYIVESMQESRKALLDINRVIEDKLTFIMSDNPNWKETFGVIKKKKGAKVKDEDDDDNEGDEDDSPFNEEFLKANNYGAYTKIFKEYISGLPLPVFIETKEDKRIKLNTIPKFLVYVEIIKAGLEVHEDDRDPLLNLDWEIYEKFKEVNGVDIVTQLAGEDGKGGVYRDLLEIAIKESKHAIAARDAEIAVVELKKDGTPKKSKTYRKKELDIIAAFDTSEDAIELLSKLYLAHPDVRKKLNTYLDSLRIKVASAKRTINKDTVGVLLNIDVDQLNISQEEKVIAKEGQKIIELKMKEATLLKWIGTYQIKLLGLSAIAPDNIVRTSYSLTGAVTGRLSCDVHQFPKAGVNHPFEDRELYSPRRAILVRPLPHFKEGDKAIIAYEDFSQMELRVAAEYTFRAGVPDMNLLKAYVPMDCYHPTYGKFDLVQHGKRIMDDAQKTWNEEEGEYDTMFNWFENPECTIRWSPTDLHLEPVKSAFPEYFGEDGRPLAEYADKVKKLRNIVKGINFGSLYGQGLMGLLSNPALSNWDPEVLRTIAKAKDDTYPNLKLWQKSVMKLITKSGFCTSIIGRKFTKGFRYGRGKFNNMGFQNAYKGVNYVVQGECAALLKDRMIAMEQYIRDNKLDARLLQNIHDEVAIILPYSEKEHIFNLRSIIQDAHWYTMMVSDIEITTTNWAEKQEIVDISQVDEVFMKQQGN